MSIWVGTTIIMFSSYTIGFVAGYLVRSVNAKDPTP